jgi:nucleotide-binding universal stress UspA family protein
MNDTPDQSAAAPTDPRVFLIIVDDSDEWRAALRYACRRAKSTRGRVALLRVIEPAEFQHWMAVEDVMREEAREEAEGLLQRVAREVNQLTGQMPALYVREGGRREELLKLIDEEPMISILVLAAAVGSEGPGPLIQELMTKRVASMRIPVTIVPGNLSEEDIDALT